jgi:hypothetical protein
VERIEIGAPITALVVDGLMVVDLAEVRLPILQRYMSKEGAALFLATHKSHGHGALGAQPVVARA